MVSEGLVNGTRLILLSDAPPPGSFLPVLHVETVPLPGSGDEPVRHFIPRISFDMVTNGGQRFTRRTFPVRVGFALTCNKSQGQTLIRCLCDVRTKAFAHGTTYTQCSRVSGYDSIGFLHNPLEEGELFGTMTNYVIQQSLNANIVQKAVWPPQAPVPTEVEGGGADSVDSDGEEDVQRRGKRVPRVGPQKAKLLPGALSMTERRKFNYERVKQYYS